MKKKKNRIKIFRTIRNGIAYDKIMNAPKEARPFCYKEYKIIAGNFYKTDVWRKLRYRVLRKYGGRCQLCGRSAKDGVVLHVDHIIPLSIDFSKAFDEDNLQVLCEDCNIGKSNSDCIDWRK